MERLLRLRSDEGHPEKPGEPLPQDQAAQRAGVTVRQWQRWESGVSVPYARNLAAVADAFGFDVAEFYDGPAGQAPAETPDPFAGARGEPDRLDEMAAQLAKHAARVEELLARQSRILKNIEDGEAAQARILKNIETAVEAQQAAAKTLEEWAAAVTQVSAILDAAPPVGERTTSAESPSPESTENHQA